LHRTGLIGTAAAALVLAGFSAHAQSGAVASAPTPAPVEVVSTAPATGSPQTATQDQIADWIKGAPPLGVSDDENGGVINVAPDKGVHGEAGAFVSNRGYGGYVAATMPVGKDTTLGLAVADTQYTGRYYRGNAQSLAASLAVGKPLQRPAGCPAGVQVGDHYVEPLWASRMRGAPLTDDPDGCFGPVTTTR